MELTAAVNAATAGLDAVVRHRVDVCGPLRRGEDDLRSPAVPPGGTNLLDRGGRDAPPLGPLVQEHLSGPQTAVAPPPRRTNSGIPAADGSLVTASRWGTGGEPRHSIGTRRTTDGRGGVPWPGTRSR